MMEENEIIYSATEVIETPAAEVYNIEMSEAFPASQNIDALNHALLNNREINDAHPITAITGLRQELDSIEALQTIYSDKKGNADYYEWADGNYGRDNRLGLFVTLSEKEPKISICTGDDIFGVVVDSAAFVGGQDDIARDFHYGLVATNGAAHVLCELNVKVGDYIVSNNYGVATKSKSDYGYKVVALHNINGVLHATINLNISADQVDSMGAELQGLDSRMNAAETNIVSAINVANEAYKKSQEATTSLSVSEEAIKETLESILNAENKIKDFEQVIDSANATAAQARAIAESAATSAISLKNEAVDKSKEALTEITELSKEIKQEMSTAYGAINKTNEEFEKLSQNLTDITEWTNGTDSGVTGFVNQVDEHSATLASIAKFEGEFGESLAGFVRDATNENTTVAAIASYDGIESDGAAGLIAQVNANMTAISTLAELSGDGYSGLAGMIAQVNANKSAVSTLASHISGKFENIDTWNEDSKAKDTIYYDTNSGLYYYYSSTDEDWISTDTAPKAGLEGTIAAVQSVADTNSAIINSFTEWQNDARAAMTRIEQKADANGAYIESTVFNIDKYSVGPHSQAYGFTRQQAQSVLSDGMIYIPTEDDITETYVGEGDLPTYTRDFSKTYLYRWGAVDDGYGWITIDADYCASKLNTSAPSVYFSNNIVPAMSDVDTYGYWYTNGDTSDGDAKDYEPYTLYKWNVTDKRWMPVATLAGNSQNRAVSQIRQDANSIELRVTNVEGSAAASEQWIGTNSANIQGVVSWKNDNGEKLVTFMQTAGDNFASASQVAKIVDKEGNIQEATIVAAVNKNASNIYLSADNITFDGFASFKAKVEDVADRSVYDTKVEYALSSSSTDFIAVAGVYGKWSTIAPAWQENAYMWQKTTITKGDGTTASTQTCIQGAMGEQGAAGADGATPYIKDGYWWISTTNTGVKAQGDDGQTPTVSISADGYWIINGTKTSVKAVGVDAPTVKGEKKQFYLSTSDSALVGGTWSDTPSGFTKGKYLWTRSVYIMSEGPSIDGEGVLDKTFTTISSWCLENSTTLIDGANIATGTIKADQIDAGAITAEKMAVDAITSRNYYKTDDDGKYITDEDGEKVKSGNGMKLNLANGTWDSVYFRIDNTGKITAVAGEIGGWNMTSGGLYAYEGGKYTGLSVGTVAEPSLVNGTTTSPIRIFAGGVDKDGEYTNADNRPKFLVLEDGSLYASAAEISGTIHAGGGAIGGWNISGDSLYSNEAYISTVAPNIPSNYDYQSITRFTPLTIGYRLSDGVTFRTTDWGAVVTSVRYWSETDSSLSDENYKQNIEGYSEEYERFFDFLNPVKYKYVHGTSNRFHTGFIAQDVVKSLERANLTTQDFAGIMLMNQGEPDEQWRLRRDEFVSLNTWQIQKLKARTAELENKITELEAKLND